MTIKEILMHRDGMTEVEANELIAEVKSEIGFAIADNDYTLAEEIMMYDLGLEMDYIMELI